VLAAPRVLQPAHATQFVNKILSDDGLVEAINSGQKHLSDIHIPVSVLQLHVNVCKVCVVKHCQFRMSNQNPYPFVKVCI
jgi:hypothetical protein